MSNENTRPQSSQDAPSDGVVRTTVLVVGGGISGVCMGVFLQKHGITDYIILEKEQGLGGTWYVNRYPGCECDVPSVYYSYSFAPNTEWSRRWSGWSEILEYVRGVADRFGVRPKMRFGVTVENQVWDDKERVYVTTANDGKLKFVSRFVVSARGGLSVPLTPKFAGQDKFAGASMHTAQWNDRIQLDGKRVTVIGSAASAIQVIPQIADKVQHLTILQRTPNYIAPHNLKDNRPYSAFMRFLFRFGFLRLFRYFEYLRMELNYFLNFVSPGGGRFVERAFMRYMHSVIRSPELRKKLTPDYRIGCKRILISENYYHTLLKPNVEVVTDAIEGMYEGGVIVKAQPTGEGAAANTTTTDSSAPTTRQIPSDVIIYATGFDMEAVFKQQNVYGRGGERLFTHNTDTYLGITTPRFPNYFFLLGPNTGLGSSSIIFMIECQAEYAAQCIEEVLKKRGPRATIEVKEDVCKSFVRVQQAALATTKWKSGCKSWYQDKTGHVFSLWHSTTWKYWWKTRRAEIRRDFVVDEGTA